VAILLGRLSRLLRVSVLRQGVSKRPRTVSPASFVSLASAPSCSSSMAEGMSSTTKSGVSPSESRTLAASAGAEAWLSR
jgi:hypothetical protein